MANIKSQIKRNKTNAKAAARNRGVRSALKTSTKKVNEAIADGDSEVVEDRLREASRGLDKAVSRGALHKRTVARKKSRLARAANRASA